MKKRRTFIALLLAAATCMSLFAGCGKDSENDGSGSNFDATYTYRFSEQSGITTWNVHEEQVVEQIRDYTEIPLWDMVLNDTADGYEWAAEMAEGEPEDVTGEYAGDEKWGVPADATEGYAYRVSLNREAVWEDGTVINADSYVYSMQQILNPEMNNYNAYLYYQNLPIAGAETYAKSGRSETVPAADREGGGSAGDGEGSFDSVGFLKTGEYELTVILSSPLTPFYFKYHAGTFALVREDLYEAGKRQSGDMIKTDYATSVDTYMSYGPYKMVSFQPDKEWRLTRNENWYGWTDGEHDGLYQATDIVCSVVADSATREQLFLQGKLDRLSLSADTFDKYKGSDYLVNVDYSYLYYLNINNDAELLAEREKDGVNKTILTYPDFRKGISLSMNRADFVAMQGYGKVLYGYYSDYYVCDVDTGERYRDSAPAVETLKTFYGVTDTEEITGYDLEAARAALVSGYEQALADGVVMETDVFEFDYPTWDNGLQSTKEVQFIQDALSAAAEGTALEGRIIVNMVVSEDYYGLLDSGAYDLCMSAWNGSASDPYGLMEAFVTEDWSPQAYFGFDSATETLDIEIEGEIVRNTYYDWYQLLCNGEYAVADPSTRNQILASMELGLLEKYRDCPFWSMSGSALLSMKTAYPAYVPVFEVGFGGIRSMTFHYTDAEWEEFCKENNDQLNYQ